VMHDNHRVWETGDYRAEYSTRELRPVEVVLLLRYRDEIAGSRVLEIGCGAGRLTGYLADLAAETHGIDISPLMVEHCRSAYPRATFAVGDLRDLSGFADGSYDLVVCAYNVLDVLDDAERGVALDEFHRMLAPGGRLLLSSHNHAFLPHVRRPTSLAARNPVRLLGKLALMPWRVRNHRRVAGQQRFERDYAIVNDDALNFTLLLYYIGRDAQQRQLEHHGFALETCLDRDGAEVAPGEAAERCPDLHYVARRTEREQTPETPPPVAPPS
jgi:SAM-dependent methyltransferase